jgi:hypothetical protein
MRFPISAAICATLVASSAVVSLAQDSKQVPDRVLKQLEFMAGTWDEETVSDDGPEKTLKSVRRWAPGKHCLIVEWKGIFEGVTVHATGVTGWDGEAKELVEHWFMSDGMYFRTVYPVEQITDKQWTGTTSWIGPDGKRITAACKLMKDGNNKFFWSAEWDVDGKKMSHYVTTTRKTK